LSIGEQRAIAERCFELGRQPAGFYTPIVRGGHPMSVQMLCLGKHWNARYYRYESTRSDVDDRPVPELPPEFVRLAAEIAKDAGFDVRPDICIVNLYSVQSRMGLHQDKDEGADSLSRGAPVVSLSIGDTARFLFGGLRRKDPVEIIWLQSGDAFVFGGPARLCYHGVNRIVPGTGPEDLGFAGRLNLTFREY
jgi:alkylated DNA repair protein (DNA oxidative demethylase)